MRLDIDEATRLAVDGLRRIGYAAREAETIADHLIDCELRGLGFSGLARVLSIADRRGGEQDAPRPIRITRQTPVSAQLDGGDQVGYLVARRATELVIEKASVTGLAVVGASGTWYTGMMSYFAEMITGAGLVGILTSNTSPWVAPYGGTEAAFGTNPICIAVPTGEVPFIWDIGVSKIIHAQAVLAGRRGQPLPDGVAYDETGEPTTDPAGALRGAFAAWGGHRGSGLGMAVQLLGALAGSPARPPELRDFGFLVLAMSPTLFGEQEDYQARVREFLRVTRATRPLDAAQPVRTPFERSAAERDRRRVEGWIDVPDEVVDQLRVLSGTNEDPGHDEKIVEPPYNLGYGNTGD